MQSILKNLIALTTCHWLAMAGVALTTGSGAAMLTLSLMRFTNPYYGILLFLVLPAFFLVGLLLIPAGLYLRSRQAGGFRKIWVQFEWRGAAVSRLLVLLTGATLINVVLLSSAAYEGREYLDSDAFCGTVCHQVMGPQYTRYLESSHAETGCVTCHIAPGIGWGVYHKLGGVRQLLAVASGTYARPIASSGGRIHAATDTCGQCHSMETPSSDSEALRILRHFSDDAPSTLKFTVLLMHVGKIHQAHADVEYVPQDDSLEQIPWVSANGGSYVAGDRPPGSSEAMDCIDCHNRVGHDFPTIEEAIDRAILAGVLDGSEPFTKRDAVAALQDGASPIPGEALRRIAQDHVFPEMAVTWDTYPNNIGHEDSPGCFRCHDFDHQNDSGENLFLGCTTCHSLTALEEESPEILRSLGL